MRRCLVGRMADDTRAAGVMHGRSAFRAGCIEKWSAMGVTYLVPSRPAKCVTPRDGPMDSGDSPETGLPAPRPESLESRRRSGLLSRLPFAEGHRPDSRRVSLGISAAIVGVGLSVLVGWASGLDALTSWDPGHVQTKVNAALC